MESQGRGVLDTSLEPIIGPAEGGTRWLLAMTLSNVVPVKAGTHNHRRLLEQKPLATLPKSEAAAYGSRRSPGRH